MNEIVNAPKWRPLRLSLAGIAIAGLGLGIELNRPGTISMTLVVTGVLFTLVGVIWGTLKFFSSSRS